MLTRWLAAVVLVVGCLAGTGQPLAAATEYAFKDDQLVATDGATAVWAIRVAAQGLLDANQFLAPVQVGSHLYACAGNRLFIVDPVKGAVERRISLPNLATKIVPEGGERQGVVVTVNSPMARLPWTRTYHVSADHDDVPFSRAEMILFERMPRDAARAPLELQFRQGPKKVGFTATNQKSRQSPEAKPMLEAAIAELAAFEKRDPTNLWAPMYRGEYLADLGRKEEAQAAFESVFEKDPAYDRDLIGLVFSFDEYVPALADKAFQRGMAGLLKNGYQPEMANGLIELMMIYSSPKDVEKLDPSKPEDLARLNQLGERLWMLAPYSEFVHTFFQGLSIANRTAGDSAAATKWHDRAVVSSKSDGAFCVPEVGERTGHITTVLLALFFALVIAFVLKTIRVAGMVKASKATGWTRYFLFRFWTRAEQVGFLIGLVLLFVASYQLSWGMKIIAASASQPLSNVSGFGSPANVEHWKKARGNADGDFQYALALQMVGDVEGAATVYRGLPQAEAKNNLGVILAAQGKSAEAQTQFEAALAQKANFPVAAINAGRSKETPESQRREPFGFTGKVLAIATPEMLENAYAHMGGTDVPWIMGFSVLNDGDGSLTVGEYLVYGLGLVVGLLCLIALLIPREKVTAAPPSILPRIAWGLGFLVPGTARQWSIFGTVMLGLFGFSWLIYYGLSSSSGDWTNMIEAIATPNIMSAYGPIPPSTMGESYLGSLTQFVRSTEYWFVGIFLLNLVVVGVGEWLRPDPVGPFAKQAPVPGGGEPQV